MNDRFRFRVWNNRDWDNEFGQVYYDAEETYDFLRGNPQIPASYFGELLEDDQWIVEQCTGLKDKNGKLIYEGDIIKSPSNSNVLRVYQEDTGLWRCVEYRVGGRKELPLYQLCDYGVEILGNIHENEELYNA